MQADIMEDKATPAPISLFILILGLICVLGFTIWSGCRFYLYGGGILYGGAAGIGLGAAYSILKQIYLQHISRQKPPK